MSESWVHLREMSASPGGKAARFFDENAQSMGALVVDDRFVNSVGQFGTAGVGSFPTAQSLLAELDRFGITVGRNARLDRLDVAVETMGGFHFVGVDDGAVPRLGMATPDGRLVLPELDGPYKLGFSFGDDQGDDMSPSKSTMIEHSLESSHYMLARATGRVPSRDEVGEFTADIVSGLPRQWSMPVADVGVWLADGEVPRIELGGDRCRQMTEQLFLGLAKTNTDPGKEYVSGQHREPTLGSDDVVRDGLLAREHLPKTEKVLESLESSPRFVLNDPLDKALQAPALKPDAYERGRADVDVLGM